MKNLVVLFSLISAGFLVTAISGFAQIPGNSTTAQTLSSTGNLSVINNGAIEQSCTPAGSNHCAGGPSLLATVTSGNNWAGSSEPYLDDNNIVVDVVPKPESWAMMLGGFALLLFVQARSRLGKK